MSSNVKVLGAQQNAKTEHTATNVTQLHHALIICDNSALTQEILSCIAIVSPIATHVIHTQEFCESLIDTAPADIVIMDWAVVTKNNACVFSHTAQHFSHAFVIVQTPEQHLELSKAHPEIHWVMSDHISQIIRPLAQCAQTNQSDSDAQRDLGESDAKHQILTAKEHTIIKLLEQGYSNNDIANELNRSLSTVKSHVYNIYRKLGVKNRVQALNRLKDTGA